MIGADYIQLALITYLKGNVNIITALGNNAKVKEAFYQAPTFTYPAVRVENIIETPIGNGVDRLKLSNTIFDIAVFSEQDSSHQANRISRIIKDNLFGQDLVGKDENGVNYFKLIFADINNAPKIMRLAERLWKSTITYSARLNLLNP